MTRTTALLALLAALLLAGCGGGGGDGAPDGAGTIPGSAGVTIEDEVAGSPGPFQSTEFDPPIAFNVPAGWRAREEFGQVQALRGAGEAQVVTFESTGEGGTPAQRVETMRATPDLEAGEAKEVEVAGYKGVMFEAQPEFALAIEGSEYYALGQGPVRVWVLDVNGQLVTIYAESSVLRTERREADQVVSEFFSEVDQLLSTLEFGNPTS
jgi:hypothetical protein